MKIIKICVECKKEFSSYRKDKQFCKPKCRNTHWIKLHPRIKDGT